MEESPILLTKLQASSALNVCLRTVDTLIAEKRLPVVRIGRRVLSHREALERFARHDQPMHGKRKLQM